MATKVKQMGTGYNDVVTPNLKGRKPGTVCKPREKIAKIGGREYVTFSALYTELASGMSRNTFRAIVEQQTIGYFRVKSITWYDFQQAKQAFLSSEEL